MRGARARMKKLAMSTLLRLIITRKIVKIIIIILIIIIRIIVRHKKIMISVKNYIIILSNHCSNNYIDNIKNIVKEIINFIIECHYCVISKSDICKKKKIINKMHLFYCIHQSLNRKAP